jgi:hypothetical protein
MSNSQTLSKNFPFAVVAGMVLILAVIATAAFAKPLASIGRGVVYASATRAFDRHDEATTLADLKWYRPASFRSLSLQAEAQLEEGSDAAGVISAQAAHSLDPSNEGGTLLLGAAYAQDDRSTELATLISIQTDSKTIQGLQSLRTPDIAQAQELYVLRLPRSSQRVLVKLSAPSVQRSILLAQIALVLQPGKAGAVAATPFAREAVVLDPSSITAQDVFISVSRKTGDLAAAEAHQALLARLEAGTP